jgi:glycosyltransferase involved in cell wall biosynthesis
MPAVTVVVPLHNKASTVLGAVGSALDQGFDDYDVIVIDDGSTDDGGQRVRALRDRRLTCIDQENAGASAARNRGIMAAGSRWIAFLDADDCWDRDHLAGLVDASRTGAPVMCFSNMRTEVAAGGVRLNPAIQACDIADYFAFALENGGYPNMTSGTMVRRDAAVDAGLFTVGVAMGEDVDLWCRLALSGPVRYTGAATATYREAAAQAEISSYRRRRPEFPMFAAAYPDWLERGLVPGHLEDSAGRYVHFLLLEHARQLLDQGRELEARRVLLRYGKPLLDPARYSRRLFRTFSLGRAVFALTSRGRIAGRDPDVTASGTDPHAPSPSDRPSRSR